MGNHPQTDAPEMELQAALDQLEQVDVPTGGMIAKALGALTNLLAKGAKGGKGSKGDKTGKDRLDALMDDYGLNDDEDDDLDDDEMDDDDYGPDEMDEDEDSGAPPPKVRKSLADAVQEDGFGEIIDGDEFMKSVLDNVDARMDARDREQRKELRTMRKALGAVLELNQQLVQQLEQMGMRPAGHPSAPAGPYGIRKGAGAGDGAPLPSAEEAAKRAEAALRKGIITPAERRTVELAYQSGVPQEALLILHKAELAGEE